MPDRREDSVFRALMRASAAPESRIELLRTALATVVDAVGGSGAALLDRADGCWCVRLSTDPGRDGEAWSAQAPSSGQARLSGADDEIFALCSTRIGLAVWGSPRHGFTDLDRDFVGRMAAFFSEFEVPASEAARRVSSPPEAKVSAHPISSFVRCERGGRIVHVSPDARDVLVDPSTLPIALFELVRKGQPADVRVRIGSRWCRVLCRPQGDHVELFLLDDARPETPDHPTWRLLEASLSLHGSGLIVLDPVGRVRTTSAGFRRMFRLGEDLDLAGSDASTLVQLIGGLCVDAAELPQPTTDVGEHDDEPVRRSIELLDGRVMEAAVFKLVDDDGQDVLCWSFHDVTEQRARETDLWNARRAAEAADAAKSDFLASMSHEIRTPMNSVLGMAELLLETTLDDDQRWYAGAVHSSASSLLHLINDVLDVAKIEAGAVELREEPFALDAMIVEQTRHAFSRTRRPVVIYPSVDPRLPALLYGDANRIRQVLTNLVSNAVKYTDEGEVEVRVSVIERIAERCDLAISVRDTGVGIAPTDQARVFEKYAQARLSARPGSGLGLHISRALVELMGGELSLVSEPGRGSTFTFRLALPVVAHQRDELEALIELTAGTRVLVHSERQAVGRALRALTLGTEVEILYQPSGEVHDDLVVLYDVQATHVLPEDLQRSPRLPVCLPGDQVGVPPQAGSLVLPAHRGDFLELLLRVGGPEATEPALVRFDAGGGGVAGSPSGPLRVLLVEDNLDNIAVARGLLQRRGHEVAVAEDGREGVALAKRGGIDVVLMDVAMPGMGGFEAVRRIRAWEDETGAAPVPIVAYSAHATPDIMDKAFEVGCVDFLAKPARSEELLATIKRATRPRARILVVESRAEARRLYQHYLVRAGFGVIVAVDRATATSQIRRGDFAMVLVGDTPSGHALVEVVRASGFEGLCFAIATAGDGHGDAVLLGRGADVVLQEPLSGAALSRAVETAFERAARSGEDVSSTPVRTSVELRVDRALEPLIPLFLENRRADLDVLRVAVAEADWKVVARRGQALRGMGSSYGFEPISKLGHAIAEAAERQDLTGVTASVEQLSGYLERVAVRFV